MNAGCESRDFSISGTRRLWSLWDMLDMKLGELFTAATYLQTLDRSAEDAPSDETVDADTRAVYVRACRKFGNLIKDLDLKASWRALSRLVGNLEQEPSSLDFASLHQMLDDVLLRASDELHSTKCLFIEGGNIQYYEPEKPLFGNAVSVGFPTAYREIEEAGKCLALGRSTACVFHLMRTLEVGIQGLANGLKIADPAKPSERNWANILRKIRDAISSRQRWRRKADKQFYEEAVASLEAVRSPWRNATMHVEKTYTEEEAEHILLIVKGFMMKVASKIDENGKPIEKRVAQTADDDSPASA